MIAVTGATGKLGELTIQALLKRVSSEQIVAVVRTPAKADALSDLGIHVRQGDYNQPETLQEAFKGVEKVLLVSSNDLEGDRVAQHSAAINAAKQAGVRLLTYTSILRADTSTLKLARDHKATEAYLRQSGVVYALLRNGWYTENFTEALAPALAHGAIAGAAGEGRFASAARADYAEAAAIVLTSDGHNNTVYELAGDTSFTMPEFAAEVSKAAGRIIGYNNMEASAYASMLNGVGLPSALVEMLIDSETESQNGELDDQTHTLSRLIKRPTTPWQETVVEAVQSLARA